MTIRNPSRVQKHATTIRELVRIVNSSRTGECAVVVFAPKLCETVIPPGSEARDSSALRAHGVVVVTLSCEGARSSLGPLTESTRTASSFPTAQREDLSLQLTRSFARILRSIAFLIICLGGLWLFQGYRSVTPTAVSDFKVIRFWSSSRVKSFTPNRAPKSKMITSY